MTSLCSDLRVDPAARPGWGGQWLTPVKVRVKQTQTASLTADSWQPGNRNCRTEMGCLREHPHRIQDHLTLTSNICRWDELWQDSKPCLYTLYMYSSNHTHSYIQVCLLQVWELAVSLQYSGKHSCIDTRETKKLIYGNSYLISVISLLD